MVEKMWEILTTLTEEAQNAAIAKCKELGFDPNRGMVSLDESFINLNASRLILSDAIEQRKLIQLPITIQTTILNNLEAISKSITGLITGTDEVVNLVNAIEKLNVAIWQYSLNNLSKEVLGYQTKMNQLKSQDLEIKRLKSDIENGLELKRGLEQLLAEAGKSTGGIQELLSAAEENTKKINDNLAQTVESAQKAGETSSTIQETLKEVESSASSVDLLKEKTVGLAKEVEKLAKRSDEIITTISGQEAELNKLIELTGQTHKQVESLLPGAASAGLASAFRQRKEEISKSKTFWITSFVLSLIALSLMVLWMMNSFKEYAGNTEWWRFFLQRAPLTFPLIWLGWFFSRNYGHVIRLEEDYAFKESISRSFEGYKKQMQEVDPEGALPKLCENTIRILSETPLRIFERKTTDETPANSFLERVLPKQAKKGE